MSINKMIAAQIEHEDHVAAVTTAKQRKNEWRRIETLSEIAIAVALKGKHEEARTIFASAFYYAQQVVTDDRSWTAHSLNLLGEKQAKAGEKDEARATFATAVKATQQIEEEFRRASLLRSIAIQMARSGFLDDALDVTELILISRSWNLAFIVEAFAEIGNKEYFKRLLLPCALYLDAAYAMCGHLARLYPEQAAGIAEVIQQQEHLDKPSEG